MRGSVGRSSRAIRAGILATATMDAAFVSAALLDKERFTSERLAPGLIGRWATRTARGGWRGDDVSVRPTSRGEDALGIAVHYATGVALTWLYVLACERADVRPGPRLAMLYGVATSALPLFVMFPSMGYGCCGIRSGEAARMLRVMLLGHVAFGAGIGLWTAVLGLTRPRG